MPPQLVHFGAGNIGRALVGRLFAAAGWRVLFVDVDASLVDALNAHGGYTVDIRDARPARIEVQGVGGIRAADADAVRTALATADLAGASVGAANLGAVCRAVASALPLRSTPLPVLLCENLHGAAAAARQLIDDPDGKAAFIEAAISTMVPAASPAERAADPLAVRAEAYATLYLDRDAYPGAPPRVDGVAWRTPFAAYVDRKLYLHNFPHAAAAYLGALRGHEFIWQCMEDGAVAEAVRGCMDEAASALAARHGDVFTYDENRAWGDDLLRRFANRALGDPVHRVGRDLRRKLAPDDRCIGALRLLRAAGREPVHTARAVAAALRFRPRGDPAPLPEDEAVVRRAERDGPAAVLADLCGLDAPEVVAAYHDMERETS